jgi:hypothetical protein
MPPQEKRPVDGPDTSETYERGHPGKTPGLGEMDEPETAPEMQDDAVQDSRRNPEDKSDSLAGQDPQNMADSVEPGSPLATPGREDPAKH